MRASESDTREDASNGFDRFCKLTVRKYIKIKVKRLSLIYLSAMSFIYVQSFKPWALKVL